MNVWSTDEVCSRDALAYWKDAVCAAFLRIQTEHDERRVFQGRIASAKVGALTVNDVASQKHIVRREARDAARDGEAHFFVNLHKTDACLVSQGADAHSPGIGEFSFHDGTRPFQLDFRADMALTCFVVPQSALLARCANAPALVAKPFQRSGAGALFADYARGLALAAPRLSEPQAAQAADIFLDLLALALEATPAAREACRSGGRRALFLRVCAEIRAQLRDPDLDLARAAAQAGLAARTLQSLFKENGRGFREFVVAERLQLAERLLSSPARPSVTDVAYAVGFSDLSHFSRSFRRRFGETAQDRRAAGR